MALQDTALPTKSFDEALKRMKETGEEFCVRCLTFLGFPFKIHVDSPIRHTDGARYVEGGGQLCRTCGKTHTQPGGYSEH